MKMLKYYLSFFGINCCSFQWKCKRLLHYIACHSFCSPWFFLVLILIVLLWYVCLRIGGLTTTAWRVPSPCHWLIFQLFKCCEFQFTSTFSVFSLSSLWNANFLSLFKHQNVGIYQITVSLVWFLIMAPFHYLLQSGFLLIFVLSLNSPILLGKYLLDWIPFCLQFC